MPADGRPDSRSPRPLASRPYPCTCWARTSTAEGPGSGTSALVGTAGGCKTGSIAIVRAPAATLAIAALVVAVCYALAAVTVFSLRR